MGDGRGSEQGSGFILCILILLIVIIVVIMVRIIVEIIVIIVTTDYPSIIPIYPLNPKLL